jgi:hypothetical protein
VSRFDQPGLPAGGMDAAKFAGLEPHIEVRIVTGQPCQEILGRRPPHRRNRSVCRTVFAVFGGTTTPLNGRDRGGCPAKNPEDGVALPEMHLPVPPLRCRGKPFQAAQPLFELVHELLPPLGAVA